MRLVFMGTPAFAAEALLALIAAGHEIACVYSQPPRPAGRGYQIQKSPVHSLAETEGIAVRTPDSLKSPDAQHSFVELRADAAVVVAYGLILPKAILVAPKYGCFNIHASLLPRWRGAAPIQRAIMAGDTQSGITIMRMAEGLDTGPMVNVVTLPIDDDTTCSSLHDRLSIAGAKAIVNVLAQEFTNPGTPQPANGITYARKIEKAEARIDFTLPAPHVIRQVHGLSPFPGAWMILNNARIKVMKVTLGSGTGEPGTFLDDALTIACGSASVRLLQLQREGKGVMDAATFLRGFPVIAGDKAA
jgi:methionyl-tRNA formyltransferase